MTIGKGFLAACAHKKATGGTWNTAVAAGDAVEYKSENFSSSTEIIPDETLGRSTQQIGDAGPRLFAGDMVIPMRYEGNEQVILAQIMGTAGAPSVIDTTAKLHVLKMADSLEGNFSSLAFDKKVEVHEFKSVKWTGGKIEMKKKDRVWFTPRGVASDLSVVSVTNTTATIAAATAPAARTFALFSQAVVWIKAQSAGALAGGDVLYVDGFTLDIDRKFKVDDITTKLGNLIEEPTQDGFGMVTGSFSLSKLHDGTGGNAALRAAVESKVPQKASITLTGATLAGSVTQYFSIVIYLNALQFKKGTPNVKGPGLMPYSLDFEAKRVLTIPTGFPATYIDPCVIEIYNTRATDLLA